MTTDIVPAGAGISRAPAITGYSEAQKLANAIADTEFVPRSMKGNSQVVFAAICWGLEAGLGPMQAIRGVQVVEGQVGPKPELARALVMQRGHTFSVRHWDERSCTVYGKRADSGEALELTYTIDDAVQAGLVAIKDGKPHARSSSGKRLPWEAHTKRMLLARATGDLCSAHFPDVVMGLSYMGDELAEVAGVPYNPPDDELIGDGSDVAPAPATVGEPEVVVDSDDDVIDAELVEDYKETADEDLAAVQSFNAHERNAQATGEIQLTNAQKSVAKLLDDITDDDLRHLAWRAFNTTFGPIADLPQKQFAKAMRFAAEEAATALAELQARATDTTPTTQETKP